MARILNGILGGLSGKVAGVVGGAWKGINYVRGYAIPANPQSAGQVAQRGKFSFSVTFAQSILSSVINKFWEKMNAGMSGFNSFQKVNISQCDAVTGLTVNNKTMQGSLESTTFLTAEYDTVTGNINLTTSASVLGNGLATDKMLIVVFDKTNNIAFVSDAINLRSETGATMAIGEGRTATDLIVFVSYYRGTAPDYLMSNSLAAFATAP